MKKKGYLVNEKNKEIIGEVDAVLILANGKLEGSADKKDDNKVVGF